MDNWWCHPYLLLRPPGASQRTAAGLSLYRARRLWGEGRGTHTHSQSQRNMTLFTQSLKQMQIYSLFPFRIKLLSTRKYDLNYCRCKPDYISHEQRERIFGWDAEVFAVNGDLSRKQIQLVSGKQNGLRNTNYILYIILKITLEMVALY